MKIFTAAPATRHELVHPVDSADWETLYKLLDGRSQTKNWQSIAVTIIKEEHDGSPFAETASPWLGSFALVFKQDALIRLGNYLSRIGEILPLICSQEPLYVWQPVNIIDALDVGASEVRRFRTGRVMLITRH